MRLLLDQRSYDEMLSKPTHPRDCYVRGAEYLHHMYAEGVKYLVARAVYDCIKRAQDAGDDDALLHLMFHKDELEKLVKAVEQQGVSLIPLSLYFKDGYAKVELATGRGKKDYDKRHALAERQANREAQRALSDRRR